MFSDQGELEIVHCLTLTLEKDSFFLYMPGLIQRKVCYFFQRVTQTKCGTSI